MWQPVAFSDRAVPRSRHKHACCHLNGVVYLLCGKSGHMSLSDFWSYDIKAGCWKAINASGQLPYKLQEHSMVAWENCLYVYGGEISMCNSGETPLWRYSPQCKEWHKMTGTAGSNHCEHTRSISASTQPAICRACRYTGVSSTCNVPSGLRAHTAVIHASHMYVYGGYRDLRGSSGDLWQYSFKHDCWCLLQTSAGPAGGRHGHVAAVHHNWMYVHGGMTDLAERADMWSLNLDTFKWREHRVKTKGSTVPSARSFHNAFSTASHLYIFGGVCRGHPTSEMWTFSYVDEQWQRLTFSELVPTARSQSAMVVIEHPTATSTSAISSSTRTSHYSRSQVAPPGTLRVPVVRADILQHVPTHSTSRCAPPPAPQQQHLGTAGVISGLSDMLSRMSQISVFARQPSYVALSNGSCDSIEMKHLAGGGGTSSNSSSVQLCKSQSTYQMSRETSFSSNSCRLPNDRVSFPDFRTTLTGDRCPLLRSALGGTPEHEEDTSGYSSGHSTERSPSAESQTAVFAVSRTVPLSLQQRQPGVRLSVLCVGGREAVCGSDQSALSVWRFVQTF